MTNADKIREMSNEKLAEFIDYCGCPMEGKCVSISIDYQTCKECLLNWLQKEAKAD